MTNFKKIFFYGATSALFGFLPVLALAHSAAFEVNLNYGSTNKEAVLYLQSFLVEQGYLHVAPTGAYLSLTQKAVKDFQIANGITPTSGYFGPLTRAVANDKMFAVSGSHNTSPSPSASVSIISVTNGNGSLGAPVMSNSKYISWKTANYPVDAGVNINLLRKTSEIPTKFSLVRVLFVNTLNDSEELWIPGIEESGGDLYIEVTCSSTYSFKSGCQLSGSPVKAN